MAFLHHSNASHFSIQARRPEYTPQPLRTLSGLAKKLGINQLFIKDESKRFGADLGSFKALGSPYAVYKILADEIYTKTGVRPSSAELCTSKYRDITKRVTVCVATDGNQGRGLAYGAQIFGCRCVVYIHSHVSQGRADIREELGAVVIRVNREYEASVSRGKEDARMNGWFFVSSTSWSDFDNDIPRHVMNAYMVVVEEAPSAIPVLDRIAHVFVCRGVGSIAAAIFQGFYTRLHDNHPSKMPRLIVVEPSEADSPAERKGRRGTEIGGVASNNHGRPGLPQALAGCMEGAPLACERLYRSSGYSCGDITMVCGESSAAGMGVLLRSNTDSTVRNKLGLDANSQVLLFVLEGAADSQIFESLVGTSPAAVFAVQGVARSSLSCQGNGCI